MQQIINDFFKICKLQDDVVVNETTINGVTFNIVYMSQLVDIKKFNFEIKPSINSFNYKELSKQFLGICNPITDISEKNLDFLLYSGKVLIFFNDGYYYQFEFAEKPKRSISESILDPEDPMASRDALIEDLSDNLTLIKRRLKTNALQVRKYQLGLLNKTECAVLFINKFYDRFSLSKVLDGLSSIKQDAITSINDLYCLYQIDSLLPQVFNTSSPEIITTALLRGRIVIMLDNSPIALILPTTLSTFTTSKSYVNTPKYYSLFNHIFITIFFLISIFFMGLFIAIISFHRGTLSISLLANIQTTEKGTNWPTFVEVIIVYLLFEFYRFSTSRSTNNYIQNIIIILGGLFIGQNAIQSGTIGAIILFLTSISYIAVFAVTTNNYLITSINIFRFFILILSFTMGLIGFILASIIVIFYLFKQKNNGTFYLYPFIPFDIKELKNYFLPRKDLNQVTKL